MTVLVTGGAGFIGSHIVDKLVDKEYDVIVVDNLSTGKLGNVNPNATFYCMNISCNSLNRIFSEENPQYVIHLAAQVSVPNSFKKPITDCTSNIVGTVNLLECCRKYGIEKIVYSSSAAVYGEPQYLPLDEKHQISPQSNYGISKYTAESYIKLYQHLYGLNYTVLRYANVYGPRQEAVAEGGVIAVFTERILSNRPPIIFGTGNQTRDFVFVDDVVEANILALTRADNKTLNISTNTSTSINELAEKIKNLKDTEVSPQHSQSMPGDIFTSVLDNSKARQYLGWTPRFSLEEGLRKTLP